MIAALLTGSLVVIHLIFIGRAILRPHREPASRIAWVVLMVAFPVVGIIVNKENVHGKPLRCRSLGRTSSR